MGSGQPGSVNSGGGSASPGAGGTSAAASPSGTSAAASVDAATASTSAGSSSPGVVEVDPALAGLPNCSDDDITLVASIEPQPGVYGGTFLVSLNVGNASGRTCIRDLGPAPQEVRVLRDGAEIWSSDACGSTEGSDARAFAPGAAVRYTVQWSSYRVRPDACRVAAEPAAAGSYQVIARLGGKLSAPVAFAITR